MMKAKKTNPIRKTVKITMYKSEYFNNQVKNAPKLVKRLAEFLLTI